MSKYLIILLALIFFGCGLQPQNENRVTGSTPDFKALIVQKSNSDTSWGYIILNKDRQLIKQFSIPALEGNIPFSNRHDALLAGNLVADKLNHSLRPAISKKELDSMGIIIVKNASQKK